MTKGELIRKLARRAGVSDTEAKIFFEIFLQQAAYILNPGEAVTIKGFGFFQLKKGKIREALGNTQGPDTDDTLSRFIIYSPMEKLSDDTGEIVIFNIPAKPEIQYNNIDSFFSLSIGKPVIPLRGIKNTEFFVPPSGIELRRLMESKVENLLGRSEIIKNYIKGSEYLILNPDSANAKQIELNWNELNAGSKEEPVYKDYERLSWDFGDEISKQIEEDSILDIGKEETVSPEEDKESLSWDFGDEFIENKSISNSQSPEIKEPQQVPSEKKNFQRVTSLTKERKRNTEHFQENETTAGEVKEDKPPEVYTGKDLYKNYDDSFIEKEGFTEVPNKRKTYDIELSSRDQARLDSLIKEELAKQDEADTTDATVGFYQDEITTGDTAKSPSQLKGDDYYSKKRSAPVFIIALLVIVLVGAALYFYLRDSDLLNPGRKSADTKIRTVTPAVVERNYDIPVTYPYAKKEVGVDSSTINSSPITSASIDDNKVNETTPQQFQRSRGIKIKENLFKDGDTYSVQVSSWQSRRKAEKEVLTLRNKGFTAIVEEAPIPGRGMWYRVKIGNFKTQAEAEKYLQ